MREFPICSMHNFRKSMVLYTTTYLRVIDSCYSCCIRCEVVPIYHSIFTGFAAGRLAFTASFFVDGTSILPDLSLLHDEDQESYQEWVLDVGTGNLAQHACLPLCVDQLNQT